MQNISRIGFHSHARASIAVIHKRIGIIQRIIAAARAKPQITGIAVWFALDINVGIAVVNLAILDLFLASEMRSS